MLSGSLGCGLVERVKTDVGREVNEVVRIDGEVQCGLKPVQPECPATPQPGNPRFWPHKRLRWENNLSLFLVPIAVLGFHAQANAQSNTWQGYAYFGVHDTPGALGDVPSVGVGGEGYLCRGLAAGADLERMLLAFGSVGPGPRTQPLLDWGISHRGFRRKPPRSWT